jgi:hypothetical protein
MVATARPTVRDFQPGRTPRSRRRVATADRSGPRDHRDRRPRSPAPRTSPCSRSMRRRRDRRPRVPPRWRTVHLAAALGAAACPVAPAEEILAAAAVARALDRATLAAAALDAVGHSPGARAVVGAWPGGTGAPFARPRARRAWETAERLHGTYTAPPGSVAWCCPRRRSRTIAGQVRTAGAADRRPAATTPRGRRGGPPPRSVRGPALAAGWWRAQWGGSSGRRRADRLTRRSVARASATARADRCGGPGAPPGQPVRTGRDPLHHPGRRDPQAATILRDVGVGPGARASIKARAGGRRARTAPGAGGTSDRPGQVEGSSPSPRRASSCTRGTRSATWCSATGTSCSARLADRRS